MADKDLGDGPSLEMPSLGSIFKRKKKDKGPAPDDSTVTSEDFDALVRGETTEEASDKTVAAEPDDEPTVTVPALGRSEEHTSELQSLMRISYAVFCLKKKKQRTTHNTPLIVDII